jgi:hypothetical protein
MKKALEQMNRPNIQFVRDWVRYYESRYGETPQMTEIIKLIGYAEHLEEEFERRELYVEALTRLLEGDKP